MTKGVIQFVEKYIDVTNGRLWTEIRGQVCSSNFNKWRCLDQSQLI